MTASPAMIVRAALIDGGVGSMPTDNQDWPIYVGMLPDGNGAKHNAVAIMDTAGKREGRLHQGEVIEKPGIQVIIRSLDYPSGWTQAKEIEGVLDGILNFTTTIEDDDYTLKSFNQRSQVIPLGAEKEGKQRERFSINGLASL